MTTPLVSILLPHLREPANDKALRICLDCIVANTGLNYELIVESVAERRDIYRVVNHMAERANSDWIIPTNTDVFVAPGWVEPLYEARDTQAIISPVMVECGKIGVHVLNYERNFGTTPENFNREAFEQFVRDGGEWREGDRAWYFPSLLPRRAFLDMGGFDTTKGSFPDPLDIDFWDRWGASGRQFKRVRSWVYHLQQWLFEDRQSKR